MEDAADGRPAGWAMALPSSTYVLGGRCGSEGGRKQKVLEKNKSAGVRWMEDCTSFLYLLRGKKWKMLRTNEKLDGQWFFLPPCSAGWAMALPSSMFLVEDAAQKDEAGSASAASSISFL